MTTTEPVPGWYADPNEPNSVRWFDGTTWTDHTAIAVAPPGPAAFGSPAFGSLARPALGPGWFTLAGVLQGLFAICGGLALLTIAIAVWTRQVVSGWSEDASTISVDQGARIDALQLVSYLASLGMFVLCGVLFISWLYRAHRSDRMDAAHLSHASGWAIGGWFVPILCLWRPCQMVQDVHRAASPLPMPSRLVTWWWVAFLADAVLQRGFLAAVPDDSETSQVELIKALGRMATVETAEGAVRMVAAVLALLVVRQITGVVRGAPATPAGW